VAGDSFSIPVPYIAATTSSESGHLSAISASIIGIRDITSGLYSVSITDTQGRSISQTFNASFGWFTATELFVMPDLHLALGTPFDQDTNFTITVTNQEAKELAIAAVNVTNSFSPTVVGQRWLN
jgi:hypothetical protein